MFNTVGHRGIPKVIENVIGKMYERTKDKAFSLYNDKGLFDDPLKSYKAIH